MKALKANGRGKFIFIKLKAYYPQCANSNWISWLAACSVFRMRHFGLYILFKIHSYLGGNRNKTGRAVWSFRYIYYTIHIWPSRDNKLTYINNHDTFKSFTDVFLQPLYAGDHERGQKISSFICWFIADIL